MEYLLDEAFVHGHNVFFVHKGHLQVDLGEFRLTVGPKVLITEAAGNLHIAVIAREHQQLLVELGRLGQGIELAGVYTGGHQIVTGAFGGGLDEHRGFDLHKTVLVEVVTGDLDNAVAGHQSLLHGAAAQVQIAVLEAQLLLDVGIVDDLERRGLGSLPVPADRSLRSPPHRS